jgi:hypothetical protein
MHRGEGFEAINKIAFQLSRDNHGRSLLIDGEFVDLSFH